MSDMDTMQRPEQMSPAAWRKDEARSLSVPGPGCLGINPSTITGDLVPEEILNKYKARELADLAYILNVATSGVKKKKIQTIINAMRMRERLAAETIDSLTVKYSGKQLKSLIRSIHGYLGGNKMQMSATLINWRNRARFMGKQRLAQASQYAYGRLAIDARRPIHVGLCRDMLKPRNGGRYLSMS